jgi:hypothetical protein
MPVVEKINATGIYDVVIFRTSCHINDKEDIIFETTFDEGKSANLIERVWPVIVRFIQWYNTQNQTT